MCNVKITLRISCFCRLLIHFLPMAGYRWIAWQPRCQSISESINPWVNQSIKQWFSQSVIHNKLINQSVNQSVNQWVNQLINHRVKLSNPDDTLPVVTIRVFKNSMGLLSIYYDVTCARPHSNDIAQKWLQNEPSERKSESWVSILNIEYLIIVSLTRTVAYNQSTRETIL